MSFDIKYQDIAIQIEKKIKSKKYHDFLPGQKVLINEFKVSQRTISKAVACLKEKKIIEFQKGIGNKIISGKAGAAFAKNLKIACFMDIKTGDYYSNKKKLKYINGLIRGCIDFGSYIILIDNNDRKSLFQKLLEIKKRKDIDAVIYQGLHYNDKKTINILKSFKKPVLLTQHFYGDAFSVVFYNNQEIIKKIFSHAPKNKNTYLISFRVTEPESWCWIEEREVFFKKYFGARGEIIKTEKIINIDKFYYGEIVQSGYDTMKAYIQDIKFPAVIIAINSLICKGVMKYCIEHNISIPGKADIVTIDNEKIITRDLITTIDISSYRLGFFAMKTIHEKFDEIKSGKIINEIIPCKIIRGVT